jgi:chemotaxis protein methyltransferase CheR
LTRISLPRITPDPAYSRLIGQLMAATGLIFHAGREKQLAELIEQRLSDLCLRDCDSYAEFLAGGEAGHGEMDVLIERMTIGETCFFRDPEQFAAIRDAILPDILERNKSSRQLRIWSAGCATGAEPYSLAILLMREMPDRIAGWQIEIDATDLNRTFLARAAKGKFRAWALRSTPEDVKRECFSNEGLDWTIHPQYRQWISFRRLNLNGNEIHARAPYDLILCRNVMIYFAPETSRRLVRKFHGSLGDQGWLVVGASEHNRENYAGFRALNAIGAKFYQKMIAPAPETPIAEAPLPLPIVPKPAVLRPVPPKPAPADLEGLRLLADRGDWQGASEYSRALLTQGQLDPAVHFYRALILENLGTPKEPERSLRRAIYLDQSFALAHYHLGVALKRDRKMLPAARSFGNVLKALENIPGHVMVLHGAGVTVTALKELARMQLGDAPAGRISLDLSRGVS